MEALLQQLYQLITEKKYDRFFQVLDKRLSEASLLFNLTIQLKSRFIQSKKDRISGILTQAEELSFEQDFNNDLYELLSLFEADDFKAENIPLSVEMLCTSIKERRMEFRDFVKDETVSLNKLGNALIKLGDFIRGDQSKSGDIPYEEYLKIGTRKAHRQIKIGFKESKEFKKAFLIPFNKIIDAYAQLVQYLDCPKEEMDTNSIQLIQQTVNDVNTIIQLLENGDDTEKLNYQNAMHSIKQVKTFKEQVGSSRLDIVFDTFDKIEIDVLKMLEVIDIHQLELQKITARLKEIHIELKLSLIAHLS